VCEIVVARRARSAIRSKLHREAVGGSRKFFGEVDESATGSTNFFREWSSLDAEMSSSVGGAEVASSFQIAESTFDLPAPASPTRRRAGQGRE
jgi:hypothetical protein